MQRYSGISVLNHVSILPAVVMYGFVMSKLVAADRVVGEVAVA